MASIQTYFQPQQWEVKQSEHCVQILKQYLSQNKLLVYGNIKKMI